MEPLQVENARRQLKNSKEARSFLPFYRNILKPLLQDGVMKALSQGSKLTDEELRRISAFAESTEDIEHILKRIIIQGVSVEKAINETLKKEAQG